jgi:hypothetical protein
MRGGAVAFYGRRFVTARAERALGFRNLQSREAFRSSLLIKNDPILRTSGRFHEVYAETSAASDHSHTTGFHFFYARARTRATLFTNLDTAYILRDPST